MRTAAKPKVGSSTWEDRESYTLAYIREFPYLSSPHLPSMFCHTLTWPSVPSKLIVLLLLILHRFILHLFLILSYSSPLHFSPGLSLLAPSLP